MFGIVPAVLHAKGTLWSPASIAGLAAYYRVNTINGVAGSSLWTDSGRTTPAVALNDQIGAMDDLSGNAYHVTQAVAGSTLKLRLSSMQGLKSICADWSGIPFLNFPAGLNVDKQASSIFAIVRPHSLGPGISPFNFGTVGTGLLMDVNMNDSYLRAFQGISNLTNLRPYSNPILYGMTCGAGGVVGYCGDLASQAGAALNAGVVNTGRMFARADGFPHKGELYEFMVYNRQLAAGEVTQLQNYAAANYGSQSHTKQVVMDGDSLTDGAYTTGSLDWAGVLGDSLTNAWRTYNFGVAGSTSVDLNARRVAQVQGRYQAGYAKNIAILWIGTNDLAVLVDTAANTFARIQTWCLAVKAAGFKVAVATVIARGDAGWTGPMETERLSLNTSIRGLSAAYQDAIVDLAGDARFQTPTNGTYYYGDKIHLVNGGAAVVAGLMQTAVTGL